MRYIKQMRLKARDWSVEITGGWADAEDGCAADVSHVFRRLGFPVSLRDSALYLEPLRITEAMDIKGCDGYEW